MVRPSIVAADPAGVWDWLTGAEQARDAAGPWATADSVANVRWVASSSHRGWSWLVVGPGATPRGIAARIAASAGVPADQLAGGIVAAVGVRDSRLDQWRVGRLLDVPVRLEGDRFRFDGRFSRWLRPTGTAASVVDERPALLEIPEDDGALTRQANDFLRRVSDPDVRVSTLRVAILINPFAEVFTFFAVLRQLPDVERAAFALRFTTALVAEARTILAGLTAGAAILRRLVQVHTAHAADPAHAAAAGELAAVLAATPAEEVPETAEQLAVRGRQPTQAGTDPISGLHRMVLGRDVRAGGLGSITIGGRTFRGPADTGRLSPQTLLATGAALVNPTGDARIAARLRIVAAVARNEGALDAIRMRDAGILSTGMFQWSAHADSELPELLGRFARLAPDEYLLFFELYGLGVRALRQGHVAQRVARDGTRVDLVSERDRIDFYGGRTSGTETVFASHWAARFRLASLASLRYRLAQVRLALDRIDRLRRDVGTITLDTVPVPVDRLITSELGVALLLDAHVNLPGAVRPTLLAAARASAHLTGENRERDLTARFQQTRRTHNTPARNRQITTAGLSDAPGSFTAW
ncbi:MAG TPA: hypothetical protein VGX25_02025 [Actinophytocola sp.]|uniref:hypothetical protein n=1 Tax=Actinophytocola sp. TaxID=1872138 RepID=UPI002DDCEF80|nr:hypothetical protein [Actinophytocola sp.]HEV2778156.1 hypothetical protein [Actinophytocola sp.]